MHTYICIYVRMVVCAPAYLHTNPFCPHLFFALYTLPPAFSRSLCICCRLLTPILSRSLVSSRFVDLFPEATSTGAVRLKVFAFASQANPRGPTPPPSPSHQTHYPPPPSSPTGYQQHHRVPPLHHQYPPGPPGPPGPPSQQQQQQQQQQPLPPSPQQQVIIIIIITIKRVTMPPFQRERERERECEWMRERRY